MENRTCKTCFEEKLLDEFRPHVRNGKTYWEHQCRACAAAAALRHYHESGEENRAKARARYAEDPQKHIDKVKNWYAKNKDRAIARSIRNRRKNPEIDRASSRKWRANNPMESRLLSKARRARLKNAKVGKVTKSDILDMHNAQNGMCAACGIVMAKWHVDHIMPLALGGAHEINNLQLLCPPCNLSKSSKHPAEFMRSRETGA
jgi:5-methylcytosine-specific restriction endonuclease McrA